MNEKKAQPLDRPRTLEDGEAPFPEKVQNRAREGVNSEKENRGEERP